MFFCILKLATASSLVDSLTTMVITITLYSGCKRPWTFYKKKRIGQRQNPIFSSISRSQHTCKVRILCTHQYLHYLQPTKFCYFCIPPVTFNPNHMNVSASQWSRQYRYLSFYLFIDLCQGKLSRSRSLFSVYSNKRIFRREIETSTMRIAQPNRIFFRPRELNSRFVGSRKPRIVKFVTVSYSRPPAGSFDTL